LVLSVSGHPDVSRQSPASSPRVLNEPIGASIRNSPSDSENSVVQLGRRASGFVVDSGAVKLERALRSIDSNRGGSKSNLCLEVVFITLVDIGKSSQSGSRVGSVIVARSSILGSVGIRSFGVNSLVGNDVSHGLSHKSSFTSLVSLSSGAIHQVLFGQRNEALGGKEVATFGRTGGGERPARSALFLVLNGSNGALGSPIKRNGESRRSRMSNVDLGGNISSAKIDSGKFISGEVSKLVHGNGESLSGLVVSLNEVHVRFEDSISVLEFIVGIGLLVLLHPKGEGGLIFEFGETEDEGNQKGREDKELHCAVTRG
jgi:hypothetical protein